MPDEKQNSQFNILQLLVLTSLIGMLLSVAIHFEWPYYPSFIQAYYQQSPPERKFLIMLIAAMLPGFVCAVIIWGVFRLPYLFSSYRKLSQSQQERRNELCKEIEEYQRAKDHQSGDSR